ncbi:MAG: aminotransferase class III-fold pyridoxal phosphate-dependent enzyme, partial [Flavobacteriales bacterium]
THTHTGSTAETSNQFTVVPDLLCLSKALTGGALPMSLTLAQQWLYDVFLDDKFEQAFLHGHSFTGNPVGCAAALASLDLMEEEETWQNIKRIEVEHQKAKVELEKLPQLSNVRVKGSILAMEYTTSEENSYLNPVRMQLQNGFMSRGLLIRPLGNTIYLLPPFVISNEELQLCYQGIMDVVAEVSQTNAELNVC